MLALREVLQTGCIDQQALAVPPIVSNHGPQHQQQASPNSAAVPSAATNHNSQLRQGNEATHASNPTHQMDRYAVQVPALLGIRCFVDASTMPDQPNQPARQAGIGIFIVNTQVQPMQTIYIKAAMTQTHSVIMAEAIAMALAAKLMNVLNFNDVCYLSDCSQLVQFLNVPQC
jgi:hypothetical protein